MKNSTARAQSLVDQGIHHIGEDSNPQLPTSPAPVGLQLPHWQWIVLATAATVLIAVMLPVFDTSRSAMAAVNRSLQQALNDVGRRYELKTRIRIAPDNVIVNEADLYVKGGNRFAIRVIGPLKARPLNLWIGNSFDRAWVVPPIGPVLLGNRRSLADWVSQRNDIATPYLHISSIIERMQNEVELEVLPDTQLQLVGHDFECQHIVATMPNTTHPQAPSRIELWSEKSTGIAIKLIVDWKIGENQLGRERLSVVFAEKISLEDSFFTPAEHGGRERSKIDFQSGEPN